MSWEDGTQPTPLFRKCTCIRLRNSAEWCTFRNMTELRGWKAIANYLGCATRTAIQYADTMGLPVLKIGFGVAALPEALDQWKRERTFPRNSRGTP